MFFSFFLLAFFIALIRDHHVIAVPCMGTEQDECVLCLRPLESNRADIAFDSGHLRGHRECARSAGWTEQRCRSCLFLIAFSSTKSTSIRKAGILAGLLAEQSTSDSPGERAVAHPSPCKRENT